MKKYKIKFLQKELNSLLLNLSFINITLLKTNVNLISSFNIFLILTDDSQDTDEPKSIPKTYPKYTKETDHIFVTTDYETSLNKTNNKSNTEVDKEESKKGSSALITVLVIILFAVIFMILVAIIIKRKKRKHIKNVSSFFGLIQY